MTVWIALTCPDCQSTDLVKNGKSRQRKQRYRCRNLECPSCTFILDYEHNNRDREVKQKIAEMPVSDSGIRDTARVLSISTHTVMKELKKKIFNRSS